MDECKNNSEKSSTPKVGEHFPSGFSIPAISLFKDIINNHNLYSSEDYWEKISECLKSMQGGQLILKRKNGNV